MTQNRLVIKVGTNVITQSTGLLDLNVIQNLVLEIVDLKKQGYEIILVSSGAMGAGRSLISLDKNTDDITKRQILSSIGQTKLINTYENLFSRHGFLCAQILATKEDFRDRDHYLNMKNCFTGLLQSNVIPIINENDVVSITELMFTDNDELAGLIAAMLDVEKLILLSNVDGIYSGDPKDKDSELIKIINPNEKNYEQFLSTKKSQFGRGGMLTKTNIARKISSMGITTYIGNGKKKKVLTNIVSDIGLFTKFLPDSSNKSAIKKWLAVSEGHEKGEVYINKGAEEKLLSKNKAISLLPIGITKVVGIFSKGDILKIFNHSGSVIGIGKAQYDSGNAVDFLGKKSKKPLIHYDYLFLY